MPDYSGSLWDLGCHSRAATWHIKRTQLVQHAGKLHGFDALLSET